MNTSESMQALRRANPRGSAGFGSSLDAAATAVRARISVADAVGDEAVPWQRGEHPGPRRLGPRVPVARVSLVAVAAAGVATATFLATGTGMSGGLPAPAPAFATVTVAKAADLTGALADQSGTAIVAMTHNGQPWTGATIRWNGHDLSVARHVPGRSARDELRVVNGVFYSINPQTGHWLKLGSPDGFVPGSGTSPGEYLATVSEDTGGATLHRIVASMTGLTTRHLAGGSTVYDGAVPAGVIAREQGFKEGQPIRVLPFGYVAHDEAANPAALLAVRLTAGTDGIIRQISVRWGTSASAWTYTVAYSGLGHTPAPVAPKDASPRPSSTPPGAPSS